MGGTYLVYCRHSLFLPSSHQGYSYKVMKWGMLPDENNWWFEKPELDLRLKLIVGELNLCYCRSMFK